MKYIAGLLIFGCLAFLSGQDRDFLNADEIDQVRIAQDPNDRLKLYITFAQQRVAMIQQMLTREKPGRSLLIHDILEDYAKIIEAIDTVADDALKRKQPIAEGMKIVAPAEKEMAEALQKIDAAPPKDYARYEFALQQAIETTTDSAELSGKDLEKRAAEVQTREQKEKAEMEEMMGTKEKEEKKAAAKAAGVTDTTKTRKPPTLLRKGETLKKTDQ